MDTLLVGSVLLKKKKRRHGKVNDAIKDDTHKLKMKTEGNMILIFLIGTICTDMVFTHEPGRGHHGRHRPQGGGGRPHHRPPSERPSGPSGNLIKRGTEGEIPRCLLEDASSILSARLSAKANVSRKSNFAAFFARCKRDGSFKCYQEWPAVGLSWQSDHQGRVMENTLTRGKSNCSREQDFRLALVCTHGSRMLRCRRGTILYFMDIKANHVQAPNHKCSRHRENHGNNTVARNRLCNVTKMIEELRSRCQGRKDCWIKLSRSLIGKACTREVAFLRVNYTCEQRVNDLVENPERPDHLTYSDHLDKLCPETHDEETDDVSGDDDSNAYDDYVNDVDDGWSDNDDDENYPTGYDEDIHDILDDEMAQINGFLFKLFEHKSGKDHRPRYNWIKQPDLYNEFKFNFSSVCPENQPLLSNCNQRLCKDVRCDNRRNVRCRVNPCGTCRPECYDVEGNKVQTPRALTKCEYQRKEMRHQSFRGHVPRCKEDGSFAEIQCYHEVKICWCVDKEGRERNGTRQKGAPSNCSAGGQVLSPCQTAQLSNRDLKKHLRVMSKRYERTAKTLRLRAQNATQRRQQRNESWQNIRQWSQRARTCRKFARVTRRHAVNTTVPNCAADGSYDSKQCAWSRKFCWCVDENGGPRGKKQLKRYEKLNCSRTAADKPGMCPVMPTSAAYRCKSQCATDADCEGEHKCCMMGCGRRCVPPNEPVCPKDKPFKLCIYDKCLSSPGCFNHPTAYCRMNYCGGCVAEYFDKQNRKVDCSNGTQCQIQRHSASEVYKKKFFGVFGTLPVVIPGSQVEDYGPGSVGGQDENGGSQTGINVGNPGIQNGFRNGALGSSGSRGSRGPCGFSGSSGSSGSRRFRTRRRGKGSINGFRKGDQSGQERRTSNNNENNGREEDLGVFIPVCDSKDGAFITEQCNTTAGVCWCVDGNGREILNTREKVERGKRNCAAAVIKFKSDEKKGVKRGEGKKGQNELRVARVTLRLAGDYDEVAANKERFIRYVEDEIVKKSNNRIKKKQIRNIKLERGGIKVTFEIVEDSESTATLDEILATLESHIRSKNFVVKMQDKEYPSDGAFHVSLHVQRDDDRKESEPKRLLAMIDAATIGAFSGIILFGAVLFVLKLCLRRKKKDPENWQDKVEEKPPVEQYVMPGPEAVTNLPPKTGPELETGLSSKPDSQDHV